MRPKNIALTLNCFRALVFTLKLRYSKKRTRIIGRLIIVFVGLCCFGGLIARSVSAGLYLEASRMGAQLATTCGDSCNATIARTAQYQQWLDKVATASRAESAQVIFESCSLLAVASAFVAVCPICAYINRKTRVFLRHSLEKFHSVASQDDHAHKTPNRAANLSSSSDIAQADPSPVTSSSSDLIQRTRLLVSAALREAASQRTRTLVACSVVIAAYIPRCVYSVISSYGSVFNDLNRACKQCESCQSAHTLINTWLGLTPELTIFVTMFSEPVALSASLWCMMAPRERRILRSGAVPFESNDEQALTDLKQGVHIDLPVSRVSQVDA